MGQSGWRPPDVRYPPRLQAVPDVSPLFACGLNHDHADAAIRSRAFQEEGDWPAILRHLKREGVGAGLWLSTCNRLEIIGTHQEAARIVPILRRLVAERTGLEPWRVRSHWQERHGLDAARHLLAITCALKSEQVGEPFVLGQVRAAWTCAERAGMAGEPLAAAMRLGFRTAALVRQQTALHAGSISLPAAVCRRIKSVCGEIKEQSVLAIGPLTPPLQRILKALRTFGLARLLVTDGPEGVPADAQPVAPGQLGAELAQAQVVLAGQPLSHVADLQALTGWLAAHRRRLFIGTHPLPDLIAEDTRLRNTSIAALEQSVSQGRAERLKAAEQAWAIVDRQLARLREGDPP